MWQSVIIHQEKNLGAHICNIYMARSIINTGNAPGAGFWGPDTLMGHITLPITFAAQPGFKTEAV
jgi:hypothetical protein